MLGEVEAEDLGTGGREKGWGGFFHVTGRVESLKQKWSGTEDQEQERREVWVLFR